MRVQRRISKLTAFDVPMNAKCIAAPALAAAPLTALIKIAALQLHSYIINSSSATDTCFCFCYGKCFMTRIIMSLLLYLLRSILIVINCCIVMLYV